MIRRRLPPSIQAVKSSHLQLRDNFLPVHLRLSPAAFFNREGSWQATSRHFWAIDRPWILQPGFRHGVTYMEVRPVRQGIPILSTADRRAQLPRVR